MRPSIERKQLRPGISNGCSESTKFATMSFKPAFEEIAEMHGAIRALERVVLLDLDHGQVAALDVQRVPLPGQLLLLGQQCCAGRQPLVPADDLRHAHGLSLPSNDGAEQLPVM